MAAVAHISLNTGQKVSAGLHIGLIVWIMLFDVFARPDDQIIPEVTEVALISAQDFAQLTQPAAEATPPVVEPMTPPPARPEPIARPDPVVPQQPIAPPEPIVAPAPPTPAPAPPTPEPPAPAPPQAAVIAPVLTPESSIVPVQRPADRVAPEAAPTPDPQITTALQDQAAAAPDSNATVEADEAQDATQREAAATETVTEATRISETEPARRTATAPEVSLRPRRRPQQAIAAAAPAPTPAPQPQPAPDPVAPQAEAIENALAEALAGALGAEPAPTLAASDIDALRLNIESCWNVGILSTEALGVVITIGFELTPDARPIETSINQVSATGGSLAAQLAAFEAGRQAIVQCGINGYGLPSDLYDQWRFVEITFNPARMMTR